MRDLSEILIHPPYRPRSIRKRAHEEVISQLALLVNGGAKCVMGAVASLVPGAGATWRLEIG